MAQLRLEAATEEEIRVLVDEIRTALVVEDLRVWRGRKGTPPAWLGYAHVRLMQPGETVTPALSARTRAAGAEPLQAAGPVRPTRVTTAPRRRAAQ